MVIHWKLSIRHEGSWIRHEIWVTTSLGGGGTELGGREGVTLSGTVSHPPGTVGCSWAQSLGRSWAQLGAVGRSLAQLGTVGWAQLGAVGRSWAQLDSTYRHFMGCDI